MNVSTGGENSDRDKCIELLGQVLEGNPHHTGALVLQAELSIGGEQFDEAAELLRRADLNGSLASFLNPPLEPRERTIGNVEGWILGVA